LFFLIKSLFNLAGPINCQILSDRVEDEENHEEYGSTTNVESCVEVVEDSEALKGEDNDPANPEASSADHRILDDELTDTTESNHDNDADRVPFVHAAPEKSNAEPPKRLSGGFVDEHDLLLDMYVSFAPPEVDLYFLFILTIRMPATMRAL
jgi:hypothetical protein